MDILFLTTPNAANMKTGDGTQLRMTMAALQLKGHNVEVVSVSGNLKFCRNDDFLTVDDFEELCSGFDVIHVIPPQYMLIKKLSKVLCKFPVALSTSYWNDVCRIRMALRNNVGAVAKFMAAMAFLLQGSKSVMNFGSTIDVFLPNSNAEAENIRRHFSFSPDSIVVPVPNAVEPQLFSEGELLRPDCVPPVDYIVCPGVFAPRKNQLGLIRALKDSEIPVVFMGGGYQGGESYYHKCLEEAADNMVFLGHVSNQDSLFWKVLKHSRCACLASDCETPGIALLEAALMGSRPIITENGGTKEYYGFSAEYFDPLNKNGIEKSVKKAWGRGQLSEHEASQFKKYSWGYCADITLQGYSMAIQLHKSRH